MISRSHFHSLLAFGLIFIFLAGQVIKRLEVWAKHTEARAAGKVLSRVPKCVSSLEDLASDALPVCLGIGDRGRGGAKVGPCDRPSGLGDPDPRARLDAIYSASCLFKIGTEGIEALFDADAFPVGVAVRQVSKTEQVTV